MARAPHDLSVRFESLDGRGETFSCGSTVADRSVVLGALTDKLGIGFESASANLIRREDLRFPTPRELQTMKVIGPGGFVVWEGRVQPVPKGTGKNEITAGGWFQAFRDDSSYAMIYADSDLSHWAEQTLARQGYLIGAGVNIGVWQWTSGKQLVLPLGGIVATFASRSSGGFYIAPAGCVASKVIYTGTASIPGGWGAYFEYGNDDSVDMSAGLAALTADGAEHTLDLSAAARYIEMFVLPNSSTTPAGGSHLTLSAVKVMGDHGLTNIYASEVLKHLISNAAPVLTYTDESIEDNTYEIGHLIAEANESPERVLGKLIPYHLWNVEVWEGRCVHWKAPKVEDDYDFLLDRSKGAQFKPASQGQEQDLPVSAVDVLYSSVVTGRQERVTSDDTAALADTSEDNPCNIEGVPRTAILEIGFPVSEADAVRIGSLWLAENRLPTRAGEGLAPDYVKNRQGQDVPSFQIRSGDRVKYTHDDTIFTVYGGSYDPQTGFKTLQYDDAPLTTEGIMERVQSQLTLKGAR